MPPTENSSDQPTPPSQRSGGERVIQPLNPGLVVPQHITPVQPVAPTAVTAAAAILTPPASSYDPTSPSRDFQVPSPASYQSDVSQGSKLVSLQHKSLLIFAVLGLVSAAFDFHGAVQLAHAINAVENIDPSFNLSNAKFALNVIWASAFIGLAVSVYFLLAKNARTVATILKVILILQVIAVFGVFFGGSISRGANFYTQGARLLYIFVMYRIIKDSVHA